MASLFGLGRKKENETENEARDVTSGRTGTGTGTGSGGFEHHLLMFPTNKSLTARAGVRTCLPASTRTQTWHDGYFKDLS